MKKRKKSPPSQRAYELLESRRLLAGDVTVLATGNSLDLFGDNASNEIVVDVTESGSIEISGRNATSINGGDQPFVFEPSNELLEDIRIFLAAGDDVVLVEDIQTSGRAIVRGGSGDDSIGFLRSGIGQDLYIDSGAGADNVSLETMATGGNLSIQTRGGSDAVGIDDAEINGRTMINSGGRSDRVVVRDSIHQSRVRINTRGGSDFVSTDAVTINDVARIQTGARADNLFVNDSSFNSRVIAKGAGGDDSLEVTGASEFQIEPRIFSFEGSDVIGGIPQTDQVFSDLIVAEARLGTIVELAVMTPDLSALVAAVQATGLDTALSGDGPFTVFAPLNVGFEAISEVAAGLTNEQLSSVLQFHVVAGELLADELIMLSSVDTILGQSFSVDTTNGVVLNGNATLAMTDIRAKNGVIHLLNDVLIPTL